VSSAARSGRDLAGWLRAFVREEGFLQRYPYYASVLGALTPVLDPSVPLMGLSLHGVPGSAARYYLHVNLEAVRKEPQYIRGLLLHEVHHLVLGHLARAVFFDPEQPDLMLLAQEMSANEFLEEPLPDPIVWQHFERFGVRKNQSTMERYELLRAARAEGERVAPKHGTEPVDRHDWDDREAPPSGGMEGTQEILHHAREEVEGERGPIDRKDMVWLAGRSPDELLAMLGGEGAPEVYVDWKDALRTFVARARAPVHTWSRPSRRFPDRIGQIPGRAYRPRSVLRPTLVVAIDTSLSMSARELTETARQLTPMSEVAQLLIVECDAAIGRIYPFAGTLSGVKGRGGTDLRPVFDPAFLMRTSADGVVYFTDGQGPYPETPPSVPVLWMLTKPADFDCPWGERASLTLRR
jgi:predicted metal-dependent peptidase